MIATQKFSIQEGLKYTEEPHGYTWFDVPKPYVSGIIKDLGLGFDYSKIPQDKLEHKNQIGKGTHLAMKLYNKGTLDHSSIAPEIQGYFDSYLAFLKESGAEVLAYEIPQYSELHGFACTPDLIVRLNNFISLIDAKTSASIDPAVEYQLWFNEIAWNENHKDCVIQNRFSLKLQPNGRYKLDPWNKRSAHSATKLLFTWRELQKRGLTHV